MATCSWDYTVKIWSNWNLIQNYTGHISNVYDLEWITSDTIASGSYDQTIQIWSISTGQTQRTIQTESGVRALQLLNNRFHLACGILNGPIKIYNLNDGSLVKTLLGHLSHINDLILIQNGDLLASSSYDNSIRIWNLTTNKEKLILNGHSTYVYGLKLIGSNILASGCYDASIMLWNTTDGTEIRQLTGHKNGILWSVDYLSNGQTLVSGSEDKKIKFWNLKTGECLKTKEIDLPIKSLSIIKF